VKLRLPAAAEPAASVVMVTHGGLELTIRALDALQRHTPEPFEAIVVDNASPGGLADRLAAEVEGLDLVRNADNRGFGPACNQGAERARAPVLAFVNSDALVHAGWLAPLLSALERPGVVAAAPRLLNEDGTLQEAGALVGRGGRTASYGEGGDPAELASCFPRVVDYASAACLLVERAAFEKAGGFDPVYAPAYYEDSDLCLRLAAAGGRVVYEPGSSATHVRYGSGSSELARELSDRNRATFAGRFAAQLADRPHALTGRGELAARDALAHPRLLVLAERLDEDAARLATALSELCPAGRTTVHVLERPGDEARPLLAAGVEVACGPRAAWLAGRALHYDAVFAGAIDARLEDELDAAQPGACRALPAGARRADVRLSLPGDPGELRGLLARALPELGVAPG
jgi:GT2 family glycosyltransferase